VALVASSVRAVATFETDRLLLRPLAESDLDAYAALMADPDVVRYLTGATLSRDDAWRQMATMVGHGVLRGYTNNAVVLRDTGEFIGRIGLWNPEGWPGIEVGWCLRRDMWGKGYATEAAGVWRDHAFEELGVDDLISVIHRDNPRSHRVAERIGHTFRRDFEVRGFPAQIWGQTRAEWESRG
jgi:RimJ/RimL family protein N-acetyltransferase